MRLKSVLDSSLKISLCFICLIALISCGGNFFKSSAAKTTAESLLEDAKNSLDSSDYTTAISKVVSIRSNYPDSYLKCKTESGIRVCPREVLAGAYAGRCGLNFLSFVSSLSGSSSALFKFLMNSFTTVDVIPDDCWQAQQIMMSFSASELSDDDKYFLAVLGMAKMGVFLRSNADTNKDGTTDATFDSCSISKISDADVRQVITGMSLFLKYSSALGTLSGSSFTNLSTLSAVCGPACSELDPNSALVDASAVALFRDLFKSTDYGIETSCGNFTPLCCL